MQKLSLVGVIAAAVLAWTQGAVARAAEGEKAQGASKGEAWQGSRHAGEHPLFTGKENFEIQGKVEKVSKNSITLRRTDLPAATLRVSKQTKVELEGQPASISQLKQGQDVRASFNLEGSKPMAVEIKAEKLEKRSEPGYERREEQQREQMQR